MKKLFMFIFILLMVFMVGCKSDDIDIPIIPEQNENGGEEVNPNNPDVTPENDYITYHHTKLLMFDKDKNIIELLNVKANKIDSDFKIYIKNDNGKELGSIDDLYIGMDNIYVKCKNDTYVLEILIDGEPIFNQIRVAIRNSIDDIADESTLYHETVNIQTGSSTQIRTYDGSDVYKIKGSSYLSFLVKDDNIICYNNKVLIKANKRLIIKGCSGGLTVTSISRAIGTPNYEGDLELAIVNGKLLLINDIKIEDYLKKVVPSEMPSSWKMEALKAQAVAARTYAYKEFYNQRGLYRGYIVDDSTSSQVYNNGFEQESTNRAVLETKGQTMFNNGKAIVSYYYSAGCGLKASGNEVWITDKVVSDIPYLHGGNVSNREVDTSNEEDMLKFFKDLNVDAPSFRSNRFRWHIPMTKDQLRITLNKNIPLMIKGKESCYKVLDNGKWKEGVFPSDIGEVKDIKVSERGKSGVVISIEIIASNITFRIYNQFNIRFTLRPKDCGSPVKGFSSPGNRYTYLNTFNNPSILPSGFFSLEWSGDTLNIYGGGNGHGVGMDQYGSNDLALDGKNYKEILETYYSNIYFVDTSKIYVSKDNIKELFD